MLYGREAWYLGQSEIAILHITESHGEKYEWSEISGQEVDNRSNADVGLE